MEIGGIWWGRVKHGAAYRGINFDLSIEDVWELYHKQGKKCVLTGIALTFTLGKVAGNASLDRIKSNLGYTKDNIQLVDKRINYMKMDMKEEEFIELCSLVYQKRPIITPASSEMMPI